MNITHKFATLSLEGSGFFGAFRDGQSRGNSVANWLSKTYAFDRANWRPSLK
jgi:hypothetical protein